MIILGFSFLSILLLCNLLGLAYLVISLRKSQEQAKRLTENFSKGLELRFAETKQDLSDLASEWVDSPGDGKPSKLAELLQMAGTIVGQSAAQSIMLSLNAEKSHIARVANNASDTIQAQQSPILALLSGGKKGKGAAVMRLAELLGQMLPRGNFSGDGNNRVSDIQQRLNRGG